MKLTHKEAIELSNKVLELLLGNFELTLGQAMFNALLIVKPELANKIRSTSVDPFHSSGKVKPFLEEILEPESYSLFPSIFKEK